eukprot:TRINITY_DN5298_c0_g1_i2.p1 TRINITY_DN5298_c0_g1~~TRINITY_DN5298_c0_g1_i2.p1  ORF type:complete len:179 (+),score=35.45 TRINITY_DN5298_c0_g1_i2:71-607(+)
MIRRPPRSTLSSSSAASDVYKRQGINAEYGKPRQRIMHRGHRMSPRTSPRSHEPSPRTRQDSNTSTQEASPPDSPALQSSPPYTPSSGVLSKRENEPWVEREQQQRLSDRERKLAELEQQRLSLKSPRTLLRSEACGRQELNETGDHELPSKTHHDADPTKVSTGELLLDMHTGQVRV